LFAKGSTATLKGRLLSLPTSIKLAWKGVPGTNTLAYLSNLKIDKYERSVG